LIKKKSIAIIIPGTATIPRAWRHPQCAAIIPPTATPMALPNGMEAFHSPNINALFSTGYSADIIAEPPGAYPASPTPIIVRVANNCLKDFEKAPSPVARPQTTAIKPMVFLRLQRSTKIEIGNVKITIDK